MINKYTLALLTTCIFLLTVSHIHAWIEPTTLPPGNNIFAPLNTSSFGQSKIGGLILNIGNAAHGLIVKYGLVGIGTDNPESKLDVRGETRTDSLTVRGNTNIGGKVTSTGLEVNSTNSGALLPRMTTAQRDAIANKVEGLLIYNTDTKEFNLYSNSAWKNVGGSDIWKKNGNSAYYNEGNVGIGTNGPVSKLDVRGKALFTRDGVGECCGNDATVMIGENTQSTGRRSSISFHNGGRHEGTFELAPDGERRFRMYDNQGAKMGLETTGNVRSGGNISFNSVISTPGRMHIDGQEDLYILNKGTTRVSRAWGGTGNLSVEGSLCVGGDCRTAWPVHTWWEYYYLSYCGDCTIWGANVWGYYLKSRSPSGKITTIGNFQEGMEYNGCGPSYCYYPIF